MSPDKVISIIKKLHALSKSSNPHEAALALEKARVMMLKYNISDLDLSEKTEDIIEVDFKISHESTDFSLKLSYWLGHAFMVRPIQIKRNIGDGKIEFEYLVRFIGTVSNVAVSTFIFHYVTENVERWSKEYLKQMGTRKKSTKYDYSLGYIEAVCIKLRELKEASDVLLTPTDIDQINTLVITSNALIVKHMEDKYKGKVNPASDKTVRNDPNAFGAGFEQGSKQGLFRGVDSNNQQHIE